MSFERLLEIVPAGIHGQSSPLWAEDRAAIRRALVTALGSRDLLLTDLGQRPHHPEFSISISHAPGEGAWVAVPRPQRIGLDIEVADRLHPRLIARIATVDERARAPDPRYLWCAKESAFKALGPRGPKTVGALEILAWGNVTGGYMFNAAQGRGWLVDGGERFFAIYLVPN